MLVYFALVYFCSVSCFAVSVNDLVNLGLLTTCLLFYLTFADVLDVICGPQLEN